MPRTRRWAVALVTAAVAASVIVGVSPGEPVEAAAAKPVVTKIAPAKASSTAAHKITITGKRFSKKKLVVKIGGKRMTKVTFVNSKKLIVKVPAKALTASKTVSVVVTSGSRSSTTTSKSSYTYVVKKTVVNAPVVTTPTVSTPVQQSPTADSGSQTSTTSPTNETAPVTVTPTLDLTSLYVDPSSTAAASGDSRLSKLATTAQAKWITAYSGVNGVGAELSGYLTGSAAAGKRATLVAYGIPARDCGSYSSGGLSSAAEYHAWIDNFAAAITGYQPIVIVEPDALAMFGECSDQGDRIALLNYAATTLAATGAQVYIDAGHSNWKNPQTMARLLVQAGIGSVRGFSTNVANFRTTAQETEYATAVEAALRTLGVTNAHYVIDTARNGAGNPVSGDVCNPGWARIGQDPQLTASGDLDGYLWIKHPGESDGDCNGAPTAGAFSTALALSLLG
jgi:endoglucanase